MKRKSDSNGFMDQRRFFKPQGECIPQFMSKLSLLVTILVGITHLLIFAYALTGHDVQNERAALLMAIVSLVVSIMYSCPKIIAMLKLSKCGSYFGFLVAFLVACGVLLVLLAVSRYPIGQWLYENGTNVFGWGALTVFYAARVKEQYDDNFNSSSKN